MSILTSDGKTDSKSEFVVIENPYTTCFRFAVDKDWSKIDRNAFTCTFFEGAITCTCTS